MVVLGSFIFRNSDPNIGGTFISMLGGLFNIGRVVGEPFSIFLLAYMPYWVLALSGIIYTILFFIIFHPRILPLDNYPRECFYVMEI